MMTYDDAILKLDSGFKVARGTWESKTYLIKISGVIKQKVTFNVVVDYVPTEEDLGATDWRIWG